MGKRYYCAVELAVDVIGGKWRPVILAHLKEGVHRYGELRRRIPDMSEKMLAQRLRELQDDGLVERIDYQAKPAHVEYRLTEEGRSLAPVLQALYDWGTARAERAGTPIEAPR
ncbi:helix-turn-helix domain-containing protein [Actinocrinis sp.]|jgi:DNA-binding HxlR family transcriptional regulator|uniref:winged helix-turn-helix transcriptional regulator n=1 Tax=Actinocrinis sp. TaxID=1920516 RepID=UPI002D50DB8B|nr:helix-turn-helix domain-containing protein [Actinocrinis sp.]HZP51404.1 helix-turn-helix domain-containing protein [Actinocrinis sp.]